MPLGKTVKALSAIAVLIALGAARAANIDPELARLQEVVNSARTQDDLDLSSGRIAEYFDRKLLAEEGRILKTLDIKGKGLFEVSENAWKAYRAAAANFEADLYRGGSIQPLIINNAYSRLTAQHVRALSLLPKSPEGKANDSPDPTAKAAVH